MANCLPWFKTRESYIVVTPRYKMGEEDPEKSRKRKTFPAISDNNITEPTQSRLTLVERKSQIKENGSTSTHINEKCTKKMLNKNDQIERRSGLRAENADINKVIVKYDKTPEEVKMITDALLKNEFLKNILTDKTLQLIVDIMTPQEVAKDDIIIEQGAAGDNMYVSELGEYQVIKDFANLSIYKKNEVFGEVAIIYNRKRQATIKALSDGKLWRIHRDDYNRVMITTAKEQEIEIIAFLKTVPKLNDAPESRLNEAAALFTMATFTANTSIVTEGEEGNEFFIIRAGVAKVTIKASFIKSLTRGNYFGEQALLNKDKRRQATVIAESPVVECLVLSCSHFENLFGDLKDFIKSPVKTSISSSDKPVANSEYSDIKYDDLKMHKTLGVGGFGRVDLAYLIKNNKKTFALKYMKRKHVVDNNQIKYVFNEKKIQIYCNSEFIVKLYQTFNDRKYIYLLLELCLGGDIINLMQRHICKEEEVKFLSACVIEAISYLHKRNFIFRDLKPENMMLCHKTGYLKLTDFGFAKKLDTGKKTYTFVGTPEYMCREMVDQSGHDRAVDFWAIGIFIYELLVGKTPFRSGDPSHMRTYNLIVRGIEKALFPPKIKPSTVNLIKKLCHAAPTQRLGYKKQGMEEIRLHRWFQGFNWKKLQSGSMPSPFRIKLNSRLDTGYFDHHVLDSVPEDDTTEELDNF